MNIWLSFILSMVFLFSTAGSDAAAKSMLYQQDNKPMVKVEGRMLVVDFDGDGKYHPYLIKGVGYQVAPIGQTPVPFDNPRILERDFTLLKKMNCNTIRTWGQINKTLLDNAQKYDLKVIAGFKPYSNELELSDPANRKEIIEKFESYVKEFRNHPALLFWAIGNEDNYHYRGKDIKDWYTLVNELGKAARRIEGESYHPVAIVNGHIFNIGDKNIKTDDESMEYLDIWGANIYPGYSFENSSDGRNYFGRFARGTKKPLWVSEYGIDAWDNVNNKEYQDKQAEWIGNNWDEIAGSSVCIGGTLMAYSDEWWKGGNPDSHDYNGWSTAQWGKLHPDDYSNEEWWGVVAIEKVPGGIDKVRPRQVYTALMEKWAKEYNLETKYSAPEPQIIDKSYMKKEGIAKITASSDGKESLGPEAVVDGSLSSRWESAHGTDLSWIMIELDSVEVIKKLRILWETAAALKYDIQLSTDKENWITAASIDNGRSGEERLITFKPTKAKYIRIYAKERTTQWGYSIYEIEINSQEIVPAIEDPSFVKPQSKGPVRVRGRKILVDGKPFFIKGVGYQPVPIGYNVNEYDIFNDSGIYNRDFSLLRSMHCNAIRTWAEITSKEFLDAAYNDGVKPIYVIMGFPVEASFNYSNPNVRSKIINSFKAYVKKYKDHPAVLMWAIGNEQNYWYKGDSKGWYILVNELAKAAYEVEGKTYHPVTTPNGGVWNATGPIGDPDFKTDDASMKYLDVWGANIYSGWCFQGRIEKYADKSSKPLWISEYGFPGTDQTNQAEGADVLWDEMVANSDKCSGGTIMAYSDEWWKSGNPDIHEDSYGAEWWGIVAGEKNGSNPDIMHKREVYFRLQSKWAKDGGANIAYGKEAVASSVESDEYSASKAVDGDVVKSRWASQSSDPQWIYIDLKRNATIGRVILRWESAYGQSYKIQKSDDAKKWTDVYSTTEGDGHTDFIYFDPPFQARYLRMIGSERATQWGYSLCEFEIYEPLPRNAARGKPVYASSAEPEDLASNAVDGDVKTKWVSGTNEPQWIYVDLGGKYNVEDVVLRWDVNYAPIYTIQKSDDAKKWIDVYSTANGDGVDDYIDFPHSFACRYLRLYITTPPAKKRCSLLEFEVKSIAVVEEKKDY